MQTRSKIIESLIENLETHDKRYMFLKLLFPKTLPFINIEGSANETSYQIYFEFEKRNLVTELVSKLNEHFNSNIEN